MGCTGLTLCCVGGYGFAFVGVREKWSLRYVIGFRSIQNTEDEYLWKFSVPRRGVGKTENEKPKNRNADKGAHHN